MQSNDTEELNVTYMRFSFYPPDGLGALNGHFGTEQPPCYKCKPSTWTDGCDDGVHQWQTCKLRLRQSSVKQGQSFTRHCVPLRKWGTVCSLYLFLFGILWPWYLLCLFMVLKEQCVENEKTIMWLWTSNCGVFFPHKEQTETDAGGKFTWALKQSPWRPGFKCVCVCVLSTCVRAGSCVMFHNSDSMSTEMSLCVRPNMPPFGELNQPCPSLANWCCVMIEEHWWGEKQGRC